MPKFYYGGQAVIEGVMMRGQRNIAMAVRKPAGNIQLDVNPLPPLSRGRLARIPLLRGIVLLVETLILGTKLLFRSAEISLDTGKEDEEVPTWALWGGVALGGVLAVGLFFVAPMLITRFLIQPFIDNVLVANIIEGVIRVLMFVAYLWAIGFMKDIRRVFAYHGAEHKTINGFEAGVPLEVGAIKAYSTAHKRCGTSFLLTVLVIAIVVFALLGKPDIWLAVVERIVFIPVVAAIAYEFTRFAAGHAENPVIKALIRPGLWMQSFTTRPPDDNMLEVAILSLKAVIEADNPPAVTVTPPPAESPLAAS
jgi:uncharacterized protein YqhQ